MVEEKIRKLSSYMVSAFEFRLALLQMCTSVSCVFGPALLELSLGTVSANFFLDIMKDIRHIETKC